MPDEPQIDDPSIKLLETLRKRDKLQAPVQRVTASFLEDAEKLLEKEALEDPFDDLEHAVGDESSLTESESLEEAVEEGAVPNLSADIEESKIQNQLVSSVKLKKIFQK